MNDEPLMDVVVQAVLFFELSDEQTVNEDAAVAMLEHIAAALQGLAPADKQRLRQYLQTRAARATTNEERHAIETMPSNLGFAAA